MSHLLRLLAVAALLATLAAFSPLPANAAAATNMPFLSPLFTDNMVLQRDRPDPVWGWTTPGATVQVSMNGKNASAVAGSDGRWQATLPSMKAGGPYTLTISGPQQVTLQNVLLGDVWICSGQSNMQFGVGNLLDPDKVISQADNPNLRIYTVAADAALAPTQNLGGNWMVCTPDNIKQGGWNGFSAVGYFFGQALQKRLGIPIGLIHTSWGGTPAEAWTSAEALHAMGTDFDSGLSQVAQWNTAQQAGQDPFASSPDQRNGLQNDPSTLYNGMISPLIPVSFKGVIWYQGESNAGRSYQYRKLLPAMIEDWRNRWGEGDFPFLIVQLANFMQAQPNPGESGWAELREAQLMTWQHVPKTGMAVIIDIGDANDIHPKDKQDVGNRLALAAMSVAYGDKKDEYSGPIYKSMKIEGNTIHLSFTHTGGGLVAGQITPNPDGNGTFTATGGKLTGFAVAGADHKWVWADASIQGNDVLVSSPDVPNPLAARYAWADNPACNLYNGAGLPASPFRTDDWPGVTINNK